MDRFRSRLIIPIFDDCGEHVIAFGGRHIGSVGTSHETTEDFTPAKYINSPDSLVFTKKNILFNKYRAEQALNDVVQSLESSRFPLSTFDAPKGVVIVEGYFDAIALSNVGVKNVVACMGTALPLEQLQLAAAVGKVPGSCEYIILFVAGSFIS
jgi:DNA primase